MDKARRSGGSIPGSAPATDAQPAYVIDLAEAPSIPVMIAVPHAGRAYPPAIVEALRDPALAALKLEDRYVDLLAQEVATATGAGLLVAHAPRAMIDLNRDPDEVDWTMVAGGGPPRDGRPMAARARSGLGLVPRRLAGIGELWRRPLDRAALDARIAAIHAPYHAALADALYRIRDHWGAALLLDFHSMPPLGSRRGGARAQIVIGDRFGATCDGGLVATAFETLAQRRRPAAHNRPYAGGYVLERQARPRAGIHAMQIEICRRTYLDGRLSEPGPDLPAMATDLAELVRRLAAETAVLAGRGTARLAAE